MATASPAGVRYVVDTRASQFTVQAFASGLVAAIAHSPKIAIREWSGEVQLPTGKLEEAFLQVHIKSASLELLDELRDEDRRDIHRVMNQDVMESSRYPEVTFESTNIQFERVREDLYKMQVGGRLTLHGVTNHHVFSAQVAFTGESARAYGEFKVRQSDHNIRIASIAGGTLKLQDELKFSFYVLARKQ